MSTTWASPFRSLIAWHRAVPNSQLAITGNAGHMAQFEHPDIWSQRVAAFLDAA
ncbi:alpha/beta fold hydrolase [Stackebrandtia endophytica]|uniref:alpha/beta fold hydrolase n=1 Tax=Stackebrandtia endophytica TaxID=1496996 RepID=UPI001476ABCD|nr:hypothetical protein [Stackebrandtia endophytica]